MRRLFGWWTFAVEATRRISEPRTDVACSDRAVEPILRDSVLYRVPHAVSGPCRVAWTHSATRTFIERASRRLVPDMLAARVRLVAVIAAVASATTLIVQGVDAASRIPFGWALPMAVLVAALIVSAASGAFAFAIEDRMRTR